MSEQCEASGAGEAHERRTAAVTVRRVLPAQTSSRQTWWTPSESAPPLGTAALDTHASLEPVGRTEEWEKERGMRTRDIYFFFYNIK